MTPPLACGLAIVYDSRPGTPPKGATSRSGGGQTGCDLVIANEREVEIRGSFPETGVGALFFGFSIEF